MLHSKRETEGGKCTWDGYCDRPDKESRRKCMYCRTRSTDYIFYDFETVELTDKHNTREFVVNYVSAEDFDGNRYRFRTLDEFYEYFFVPKFSKYTFIAHNAKAFDAHIILSWLIKNGVAPDCIYRGTNIMCMTVKTPKCMFRLVDSVNFVKSKLTQFPKIFGFEQMSKGYFPHKFNTIENQIH